MPDDLRGADPARSTASSRRCACARSACPGVEADDVIATPDRARPASAALDCVIVTGDKDLMQLVGPRRAAVGHDARPLDRRGRRCEARFGVPPEQVVDVLALMGDSIDNIPGVTGIGEKTAMALIQTFGDLENVLGRLDAVAQMSLRGAKKVAERLRAEAATARLSRDLATIRRDVPVDCALDDLRVAPPDHAAARALFTELGFLSLLRQLSEEAPPLTVEAALVETAAQAEQHFARARAGGWLALATLSDAGPAMRTPACGLVRQHRRRRRRCGSISTDPTLHAVAAAALGAIRRSRSSDTI